MNKCPVCGEKEQFRLVKGEICTIACCDFCDSKIPLDKYQYRRVKEQKEFLIQRSFIKRESLRKMLNKTDELLKRLGGKNEA